MMVMVIVVVRMVTSVRRDGIDDQKDVGNDDHDADGIDDDYDDDSDKS